MKHKFFNAIDETQLVMFLAVMSSIWLVAGILIIIVCILDKVEGITVKDIPMALFVAVTSSMSFWLGLVVIVAYIIVRMLDFHSVVNGRKRLN